MCSNSIQGANGGIIKTKKSLLLLRLQVTGETRDIRIMDKIGCQSLQQMPNIIDNANSEGSHAKSNS